MIVLFYGLYVWLTPAKWSWLWFFIALVMQVISGISTANVEHVHWTMERRDTKEEEDNYWRDDS